VTAMATRLPTASYLAAVRRDLDGLLDAARAAGPAPPVESCPGWDVAELVWHIGRVHHFWATIVRDRLDDWRTYSEPDRPASDDADDDTGVFAFAAASCDLLLDSLAGVDPDTAVWTWSNENDVAFVARRMAHETAVHRGDAEGAAGRAYAVEAELASDGVDEFLEFFLPRVADGAPPLDGTVHLHCTDVEGEWLVAVDDDGDAGAYVVTREHAKGSAAVRGPADALLAVLWGRRPLTDVEVLGDAAVAERLLARTKRT
jgi:uncharacterized protein (TIGR03083 family)